MLVPACFCASAAAAAGQGPYAFPVGTVAKSADESPFLVQQLQFSRVRSARNTQEAELRRLFAARGISYPAEEIFLRAFKRERVLELWVRNPATGRFARLTDYPICALSGQLGPKRKQGDEQVPEGFYSIEAFNPWSQYHLSLGIDYPNRADRMRGAGVRLGGDIFIHGDCKTVGCLPLTDDKIEEIYWIAVQARAAGQRSIPVHIFPGRMDQDGMEVLDRYTSGKPELAAFWAELKHGYDYFEAARVLPRVRIDQDGHYVVRPYRGVPLNLVDLLAVRTRI